MQLLATAEHMRSFDRKAIERFHIPGLLLMENAGRSAVDILERRLGSVEGRRVFVVCGKGNNGGDGFVIARQLINRDALVHVFLVGGKREVKGDARVNMISAWTLARDPRNRLTVEELHSVRRLSRHGKPDIVVDALLGTGFSGSVRGTVKRAIDWMNGSGAVVVAVDVPSGIDATTGVVGSTAVRAGLTVAMGMAKIGHFVGSGRDHSGEVHIAEIGIPHSVMTPAKDQTFRINAEDVKALLPHRPLSAHKHSVGKIFILAGSRGYTGAPYLCSQAAMRIGAGAVILGVPHGIHSMMAKKVTEVMVTPLDETGEGTVSSSALQTIEDQVAWSDVVVVGPGLSRNADTGALLRTLIPRVRKPLVIDADGLNAVGTDAALLRRRKDPTILTPHAGELGRMIGERSAMIERFRVGMTRAQAANLRSILVVKGSPTATGTPSGAVYLNSSGNPGMATAGSGDVLTGMIAGLLGQGMTPETAAFSGVFLHGLCGDIAARHLGERSILAHDILDRIPDALVNVLEGSSKRG
jgi:NAD(P)H-hydrate epimerase